MIPGTIVVASSHFTRFTSFTNSLLSTKTPPNTKTLVCSSPYVERNRNEGAKGREGEWVWFLDDDHTWHPDTLEKLVAHDVDIVVPLIFRKIPPYDITVYYELSEEKLVPLDLKFFEPKLQQVYAAGAAGMLVRERVFKKMPYPWFERPNKGDEMWGEDLYFCKKANDLGFKIYCDLSLPFGHTYFHTTYIESVDDQWQIRLDVGEGQSIYLPL